jgi:hypothetical protein
LDRKSDFVRRKEGTKEYGRFLCSSKETRRNKKKRVLQRYCEREKHLSARR